MIESPAAAPVSAVQPVPVPKPQQSQPRVTPTPPRRELALTFSAHAWIKLQYLCHVGETEIGAFAVSSAHDPLYVQDLVMVDQICSSVSVEFQDEAVADFFDSQIDAGRRPEHFGRIWVHTHPGTSPQPSGTDIETFQRVFGRCDWAIMFILARGGRTFCRLRVRTPATGTASNCSPLEVAVEIPVQVDYMSLKHVQGIDPAGWEAEYNAKVQTCNLLIGDWFGQSGSPLAKAAKKITGNHHRTQVNVPRRPVMDEEDEFLEMLIDQWEDGDFDALGLGGLT